MSLKLSIFFIIIILIIIGGFAIRFNKDKYTETSALTNTGIMQIVPNMVPNSLNYYQNYPTQETNTATPFKTSINPGSSNYIHLFDVKDPVMNLLPPSFTVTSSNQNSSNLLMVSFDCVPGTSNGGMMMILSAIDVNRGITHEDGYDIPNKKGQLIQVLSKMAYSENANDGLNFFATFAWNNTSFQPGTYYLDLMIVLQLDLLVLTPNSLINAILSTAL